MVNYSTQPKKDKMQAFIIVSLIIAVLLVLFTLQNATEISVNIFFWTIANVPVVLVIVGCLIIGYLLATVYYYPLIWKLRKELKQLIESNPSFQEEEYDFEVKTKKPVTKEKEDIEGYLMEDEDD